MKMGWLLIGAVLLSAVGCSSVPVVPEIETADLDQAVVSALDQEASPPDAPAVQSEQAVAEGLLISADGIGSAKLGMTLGELKQQLGDGVELTVKSPFMADFDAIAVSQGDEVQYYVLYLAGQTFSDTDVVQGLLTDNPNFRTDKNVGPGTLLQQAEAVYGEANLFYHTQNESREYAQFANSPGANISFSTGNGRDRPAGIYANPTNEHNETSEFQDDAKIQSVLVVCLTESCAGR